MRDSDRRFGEQRRMAVLHAGYCRIGFFDAFGCCSQVDDQSKVVTPDQRLDIARLQLGKMPAAQKQAVFHLSAIAANSPKVAEVPHMFYRVGLHAIPVSGRVLLFSWLLRA